MTIDKSKFTAEELAQYKKLIAKATVPDEEKKLSEADTDKPENPKPSHESTQKSATDSLPDLLAPMRERMEQLEKSLEMKELLQVAEKYEIIFCTFGTANCGQFRAR